MVVAKTEYSLWCTYCIQISPFGGKSTLPALFSFLFIKFTMESSQQKVLTDLSSKYPQYIRKCVKIFAIGLSWHLGTGRE